MKPKWGWRMLAAVALMGCGMVWAQGRKTIMVGAAGADFTTIQAAVNAAPDVGAVIRIRPGVYREVVHVDKPKIDCAGRETIGRRLCWRMATVRLRRVGQAVQRRCL
jgi:pectin methylesterase-like acyl-CoA thioesterase